MTEERPTIEDAELAFEAGLLEQVLEVCEGLLEADPDDVDALYLLGEAMLELEEFEAAHEIFADLLTLEPDAGGAYNGLGVALFELCRFEEARDALSQATELDPRLAEARLYLGYFHERRGESAAADACYQRAVELDPESFHVPRPLTIEQVERALDQAMRSLPERVEAYLTSVEWRIDNLPETSVLRRSIPPASPLVLCLFEGAQRTAEQMPDPLLHTPESVTLYAGNLPKMLRDPSDLPRLVADAVLAELERFLDLDRAEAEALGLLGAGVGLPDPDSTPPGRVLH